MLLAEKANRVVRINDEKKDEYIGMGYTVKNMDGSIVKAPENPKERVKELESELSNLKAEKTSVDDELKKITEYADSADKKIEELYADMKKIAEESEALKAENADLKGKLKEAHDYAENADKRITELEAKLKKSTAAETAKKETKTKTADK